MQNWAGNVTYSTSALRVPRSVADAQEIVSQAKRIRPLGTGHSFNRIGDTDGDLVSTERLNAVCGIGPDSVTVEGGITYGALARVLQDHGLSLINLASLPHISVAGAVATSTHGSGVGNGSLAASVSALDLITPDGSLLHLRRGEADFDGAVVGLGALGLVARLALDVVPAFELRQYVFCDLAWEAVEDNLEEVLAGAYSVSLFTSWSGDGAEQVWVKTRDDLMDAAYFGARPASRACHPIPGVDPSSCTEQLGALGPSAERLPHFRLDASPSAGDELQSECIVDRKHAVDAVVALKQLAPAMAPLLFVSEIRAVAADTLWLSPFHERQSVAFHFTWKKRPSEVRALLPVIEDALIEFEARPHWGKLFAASPGRLKALYPKLSSFRDLRDRLDPEQKFVNDFLENLLGIDVPQPRD